MVPKFIHSSSGLLRNKRLHHATAWLQLKNFVSSASSFLVVIAAANFLEAETYGVYKYILSVAALATIFSLSGAGQVILRATARGFDGTLWLLTKQSLLYSSGSSFALLVTASYYLYQGNQEIGFSFVAAALLQPFVKAGLLHRGYLNGKKRYGQLTISSSAEAIATATIITLSMWLSEDVLLIVVAGMSSQLLFAWGFYYFYTLRNRGQNSAAEADGLGFSKHLSVMNILQKIALRMEQIIPYHFLGPAALALFSFANAPINIIDGQKKIAVNLIAPSYSQKSGDLFWRASKHASFLFFILIVVIGGYWLIAPFVMPLLFPEYPEAVFLSQLLSLSMFGMSSLFFNEALTALKAKRELYIRSILVPSVKIMLLFSLTWNFNIHGLVTAIILGELFNLTTLIFLLRSYKVRYCV